MRMEFVDVGRRREAPARSGLADIHCTNSLLESNHCPLFVTVGCGLAYLISMDQVVALQRSDYRSNVE